MGKLRWVWFSRRDGRNNLIEFNEIGYCIIGFRDDVIEYILCGYSVNFYKQEMHDMKWNSSQIIRSRLVMSQILYALDKFVLSDESEHFCHHHMEDLDNNLYDIFASVLPRQRSFKPVWIKRSQFNSLMIRELIKWKNPNKKLSKIILDYIGVLKN